MESTRPTACPPLGIDPDDWFVLLSSHADGELSDDEEPLVAGHLASCSHCSSVVASMERQRRHLRIGASAPTGHLLAEITAARSIDADREEAARRRFTRRVAGAALGTAAACLLVIGLSSAPQPPDAETVARSDGPAKLIAAESQTFDNPTIEVAAGTTVEWRNAGTETHHLVRILGGTTVDADLKPGQSELATFAQPGVYDYYCSIHPGMAGTVTVDA